MDFYIDRNGQRIVVRGDASTISAENHMQIFARLASITNMHNPPSPPRGKGGGKKG